MKFNSEMFNFLKNGGKLKLEGSHHPHKYIHIVDNNLVDDKGYVVNISLEDVLFAKSWKYVNVKLNKGFNSNKNK